GAWFPPPGRSVYSPAGPWCQTDSRLRRGAGLQLLPLLRIEQHLAGRAAVVHADDAILGHEVDQPGRAAVADAEPALQARDAAAWLADPPLDRLLVHRIALAELFEQVATATARGELHQLLLEARLAVERIGHAQHLVLGHERSLSAHERARARGQEQH